MRCCQEYRELLFLFWLRQQTGDVAWGQLPKRNPDREVSNCTRPGLNSAPSACCPLSPIYILTLLLVTFHCSWLTVHVLLYYFVSNLARQECSCSRSAGWVTADAEVPCGTPRQGFLVQCRMGKLRRSCGSRWGRILLTPLCVGWDLMHNWQLCGRHLVGRTFHLKTFYEWNNLTWEFCVPALQLWNFTFSFKFFNSV